MIHSIDLLIQDQSPAIFKLSDFVPKGGGHISRSHTSTSTTSPPKLVPITLLFHHQRPSTSQQSTLPTRHLIIVLNVYSPIQLFYPGDKRAYQMTPNETAQLLKYWIDRLTQEKESYIASLEPSPYDLLPYKAKLSIALRRIKEQKDLDLKYQIAFNNLVRSHAKTRSQQYLERMNPPVTTPFLTTANFGSLTTNVPSANPSRLVPNYASKDNVPSTDSNIEEIEANKDFLDYDLDDPNSQDSSLPQQDHAKETVSSPTDLAARVKAMTLPRIKRVDPPKERSLAMEIDQSPILSGATHLPPTSKDDDLVIITHQENPTNGISLLSKSDQGWNPWDVKRALFPPQAKREGKPKSSAYRRMKYNGQDTWAEVADIASAVRSLYKATKRGQWKIPSLRL
ncbi:hypothetical protein PCANC_28068 [Puccinia coronata f. sp. avenae]|uniref:Uncharacterized protein n=1 Tax=Puccinia coronata f. sp. avenae TaxID=200324 RepID=A0A2N5S0F5_9BASI|nr:hypothetical protein PCANC_28068 [Puccinia coronata f. sp. avenae]